MTHQTFTNKWNGRYLDWDHAYGFQCVDVMRAYVKDVYDLGPYIAIPTRGYAKDIYKNFKDNLWFKKIPNTPTGVPQKGDIIFWDFYPFVTGWAGHVGIIDSANVNNFIVFNQNYPTNNPCLFRRFNYRGVMGWLNRK
jgi:hypothetical protein